MRKSLYDENPRLAAGWHPTKNGDLKATNVTLHSNKTVWWQCKLGHEWQTTVNARSYGTECPYCAGRYAIPGETDLATLNPALAAEWHPTKNGDLKATDVTLHSNKKVWWQCKLGHEWQATVNNRSYGKDCPYCAGRYAIPGETDLATLNPALAAEWHPTKNGNLKATDVTLHSNKRVWWQCKLGHKWKATVNDRSQGNSCPYCTDKY